LTELLINHLDWCIRQRPEESSPIPLGQHTVVKYDDNPPVTGRPDEPTNPLTQLENGLWDRILKERVTS
jgi:hypothetical protein